VSIQPSILCPHCAREFEVSAKIEDGKLVIEPRAVQAQLALGPIDLKNNLDTPGSTLQAERPRDTIRFGSISESDSFSPHPLAERDSNRIVSERIASCEEDLIESIRKIVGEREWTANAPLWHWCVNTHRKAVYHALEDWKLLIPDQKRKIRNPAAWLTDRFKRAKAEIDRNRPTGQEKRANFST
jgi:hypothetical protein